MSSWICLLLWSWFKISLSKLYDKIVYPNIYCLCYFLDASHVRYLFKSLKFYVCLSIFCHNEVQINYCWTTYRYLLLYSFFAFIILCEKHKLAVTYWSKIACWDAPHNIALFWAYSQKISQELNGNVHIFLEKHQI